MTILQSVYYLTISYMKTLADLRKKCYDILREEENSNAYPYSLVDDLINSAQQNVCSWLVINPLNQMEVHKTQLPFLNKEAFFHIIPVEYLSVNVEAGDTVLEIWNAEKFPEQWFVYVAWAIVQYRWKEENSLVQCTWIDGKLKAWEQVSLIYEVPVDFMNPINVVYNHRVQIDNKDYDDVFESMRDNKGTSYSAQVLRWRWYDKPFYVIKDDRFIIIYNINTEWDVRLRYEKIPTYMENPEDECVIPDDVYAMSVIPYIAVGETMYNRWEEQRGAEVINYWMWRLREMYQFYNKTGIERMSWKNYRMAKSRFNI